MVCFETVFIVESFMELVMRVVEIELNDNRVFRVNVIDNKDIPKLIKGLDVKRWDFVLFGIHSLTKFNKIKKVLINE